MNCTQFDLKGLALGELGGTEKAEAEAHVRACAACREELDRLEATRAALCCLEEEEVPRRIAFVSDQVFEPRWWQRLLRSGPALGFASAAMLSMAILVHGFVRPAPVAAPLARVTAQAPAADTAAMEARIQAEVEKRLAGAVEKAVAMSQERQAQQFQTALVSVRKEFQSQRDTDRAAIDEAFYSLQKTINQRFMRASADFGGGQ